MSSARRTLGVTIAALRKARGLSQDELATTLDVTRTVVSRWENDRQRPRADHLEVLARVLGDDGELAVLATYGDGETLPLFETPIPVAALMRQATDGLIANLAVDVATDGQPGYGWRQDIDDPSQPLSVLPTAYGLKAMMLAGGRDWRVSLPRVRETLRRLELPGGGWTSRSLSGLARPEVTAVVVSALHDVGESDAYVSERIALVVEILDRRAPGAEPGRPYVLSTSLIELGRLDVDDVTGRRLVDGLVDLSLLDSGGRAWPVRTSVRHRTPSTVHTAAAVCALAAWAQRLDDDRLREIARSGRTWLEQNANLELDDEEIWSERATGGHESLMVRHFTPAWVVRGVIAAGGDPARGVADRALRATLSYYKPAARLWQWPRSGGSYPVWMTYHALAALVAWAGSHELS